MQDPINTLEWLFFVSAFAPLFAYLLCMAIRAKRKLTNREMLFLFGLGLGIGLLLILLDLAYASVHSYLTRL